MPLLPITTLEDRARIHRGAVLSLDLGTKLGWACRHVDGATRSGAVTFDKRGGGGHRFLRLRAWLTNFKNAAGGLEAIWYEEINFLGPRPSVENARTKFGFEGNLLAWCEHHGIPYYGVHPATIKKYATGKGNAKKPEMVEAMRALGYTVTGDDEADALALLLLALERMECGRAA